MCLYLIFTFQEPVIVEYYYSYLAGYIANSTNRYYINTLTYYEPLAFKRNTKYTNYRRGRGRRRGHTHRGNI